MVTLIALIFPAVLSLWIWETISKTSMSNRKYLYLYSLNMMLVNLGCFALKKWLRHTGEYPLENMTPSGAINYIIVAIVLSVALALVEAFLYKRVRIQIESNTEEGENHEETHESL